MIHVKRLLSFLLIGLVTSSGSAAAKSRLPVCQVRAPDVTLEPTSSCILDVASLDEARQLRLQGASGYKLPTVQLQTPTGFGGLKGEQCFVLSKACAVRCHNSTP